MNKPDRKKLIIALILFAAIVLVSCLIRIDVASDGNGEALVRRNGNPAGSHVNLMLLMMLAASVLLDIPYGILVCAVAGLVSELFISIAVKGAAAYAVPSMIVSAIISFIAAKGIKKDHTWIGILKACSVSAVVAVVCYFLFDLIIMNDYDIASHMLPINILSGLVNVAAAVPVVKVISVMIYKKDSSINTAV